MMVDLPILVILNILLLLFMLQEEITCYEYPSIYLLTISALAVFSSFLRMIPLPMGVTLAFLLPVATGTVLGSSSGFLIGQLSMLVGGFFLGGIGPWVPFQCFVMGLVGFISGYIPYSVKKNRIVVILYSVLIAFFYGYLMSISYWPIAVQNTFFSNLILDRLRMYNGFYFTTSFLWDLIRSIGNVFVFLSLFHVSCNLIQRSKSRLTFKEDIK